MVLRIVRPEPAVDPGTSTDGMLRELVARGVTPDDARRDMRRVIRTRDRWMCTQCRGMGCTDCGYSGDRDMQRMMDKAERDAIKAGTLIVCACGVMSTSDHKACRGCALPFTPPACSPSPSST